MRDQRRLVTGSLALAFAGSFFAGLSFHGFLHLPGFIHELGANEIEIGLAIAVMNLTAILARPAIGKLMDTRGRRAVAIGGAALTLVSCLLYLTVDAYGPWLYGVRVVHGLAGAAMFSVFFTIAADLIPPHRMAQGIALFGVSGMLPLSLGGLMGDAILAHGTYRDLFLVTAGLAAASFLTLLPIRESRPDRGEHEEPARSFLAAVWQRDLMPVWIVGFGFAFAIASYFTFLKTFVIETQIGSVGIFFTAYSLAAVGLRVVAGWVPDRFGLERTLYPSLLCAAAGAVLLSQAGSSVTVGLAGTLCGIGHGYTFPIINAIVVGRSRRSERGAAISMFTALFDLGLFVGSPVLGVVLAASDYETMFLSAAGVVTAGTIAFALTHRRGGELVSRPDRG